MGKRSSSVSINPPTDWTGWEPQQRGDGRQPCKPCSAACPLDSLMLPSSVLVCVCACDGGGRVFLSFITTEQLGMLFTMATVAVKTCRAKTSQRWNNDSAWKWDRGCYQELLKIIDINEEVNFFLFNWLTLMPPPPPTSYASSSATLPLSPSIYSSSSTLFLLVFTPVLLPIHSSSSFSSRPLLPTQVSHHQRHGGALYSPNG